ncbi:MAG: hypothetical protein AUJ02_01190 [Chloroflexi bacterium 13_1_40CM_3_65_12]|nr:MAG: hypothetical protein AUH40_09770 [Chloroflexi bacterium 13_1_40CM_65_17]OLC64319.1 MAG: hypothetical protein AUH69_12480 [Actinobacteria bacterium 13_1_40CM_4_65_12]OLD26871.1 MAG: hypothetical protein AUJ02_01190 [Chloroflexi bacterium 13_1_40CM_3_65_12]OLD50882.1 MAG: hypothetical protein AUI42_01180 [Actinobacteria bacterium 13_1_40CM_2_65_8]
MGSALFTNWSGTAVSKPQVVAVPRNLDELQEVLTNHDRYPSPVRAAGSFHSLTACFETTGTQVLMKSFDKIEVDRASQTITVGAAVSMVKIRDALRPHGMQTEVTPEIGNATAGSVACGGTKDASIRNGLGQVASTVVGVKMVNPIGEVESITADENPDRLFEIRSSYGLLGVIFEVTFRTQPAVTLAYDYRNFRLDPPPTRAELLGGADGMLSFAQPYANRIIVERRFVVGNGEVVPSRFSRLKRRVRDKTWESGVSTLPTLLPFNWLYNAQDHSLAYQLQVLRGLGGYRGRRYDSTIDFNFKRRSFFDFSFWAIPASRWAQFAPTYRRFCEDFRRETGFRSSLPSEVYWMAQDRNSLLSPSVDEDVFTMDPVDTRPNDQLWDELNRRFNILAAGFGGRPLLNQTKHLTRELVQQTLGKDWDRFVAIRDEEDAGERLLNGYFRGLIQPNNVQT